MQEACGEYAALLDGDDTWEPGYLAEIERLIAAYPLRSLRNLFQRG